MLAKKDPISGQPVKRAYGPWMLKAMGVLASLRGLRGRWLDPFARSADRRLDRQLLAEYEQDIETLLVGLNDKKHAAHHAEPLETAFAIASLPEQIRGFGPVRERYHRAASARRRTLLDAWAGKSVATAKPGPAARTIAVISG